MPEGRSSVRRRAVIGAIAAIAAVACWAPTAQAAPTKSNEIPSVGRPAVVALTPVANPAPRASKAQGKPFLSANPAALAKAKQRGPKTAAPPTTGAPTPTAGTSAPAAADTGLFNGLNQPGLSAADEGYCCTPPDSTGAIGPNHYVEFVNTTIRVYNRALTQVSQLDMATFVAAPAGHNVSDPQIQWDPRAGRWFYAAIAYTTHNNYLVFGWSKTSDPSDLSGSWCRFGAFTGNQLPDYPKLGHDDNFVLFAANLYDDSTGNFVFSTAAIWALPKPAAGSTTCSASGLTAFADPSHPLLNADGTSAFTPVPANLSDASSRGYIVAGHSPLAPKPSDPNGPQTKLMVWHTTLQGGTPHLFADGDLTVGSFGVPASVLQPGGAPTIDSLDARLTQAVAHADPDAGGAEAIWTQHSIDGPGGRSVLRWYEILPGTLTLRQQGSLQSSTDSIWNGSISPSIAGNDAAIFYNRGGASQLPVVAAQSRLSSTALGTMTGSEVVLATSGTADVDFSCASPYGPPCRWGDYSGASPDPVNSGVVWGTNQLNGPSFFGYPQWATQNYAVTTSGTPPPPPPPPPPPCSSVTWNAPSPASPQNPGAQVTLSATAAGCPNPLYQFWVQPPGGTWSILQAYSTASTATWNTTGLATGTYLFDAWAKQSGSSASYDTHVSPNPSYALQAPPPPPPGPPCTSVAWNAPIPASPQAPGVQVTLSATAGGCPSPRYQFWVQPPGGTWTVLQAYSAASTAAWNTSGLSGGTYLFDVWAKQVDSSASWDTHISPNPTYTLQAGPACNSVTWNAPSPAAPQAPGTQVTLKATASGCPNPVYQFWVQPPGGTWAILQPYSSASTVTWNTTGLAVGTYLFDAWARQSGSSASYETHLSPNPSYTLQTATACSSVTWNAPSPASPQTPGAQVTLSATASGCPNPVYQFWIQTPGNPWTILQAYSSASTVTWNTTGLATGTYLFDAWAKQSGSSASYEAHVSPNPSYTLQPPPPGPPCTSVTWNAPSPASPQMPGAQVTLSATASGCPSPRYQFWVQTPGGPWTVLQSYSAASTATWNTSGLSGGNYLFDVWAKQVDSSASYDTHISPNPTYILQSGPACTSVTWNAPSPASPQAPGTQVTLSATASGCASPQYQFWVQPPGGSWTILQAYSSASTATWNTSGQGGGTYSFDVWVKQLGSSSSYETHLVSTPSYVLQTGAPCTSVTLTFNPPSPSTAGTTIQLNAIASGCPTPQYQFWIQAPGGTWTVVQAYSSSSTFTWNTAGLPAGTYLFDVWVKQAGSGASWEAHISPNPSYTLN
jgi:hypothetical protein